MKEIRRKNFVCTLVEDDQRCYFFELLLPTPTTASVLYELRIRASLFQKWMVKLKPDLADGIAEKLIRQEKKRQ